jgi:hypothetical protein
MARSSASSPKPARSPASYLVLGIGLVVLGGAASYVAAPVEVHCTHEPPDKIACRGQRALLGVPLGDAQRGVADRWRMLTETDTRGSGHEKRDVVLLALAGDDGTFLMLPVEHTPASAQRAVARFEGWASNPQAAPFVVTYWSPVIAVLLLFFLMGPVLLGRGIHLLRRARSQ